MRLFVLSALVVCTLAACDQPAPEPTSPPAATEAAPAAATTPVAPAETAAVKAPEGECGDQSSVPSEDRFANTPKWSLASEQDNFGFDVFRGDTEDGEFIKLNEEPILGAGTTDETQKYQFRDDTIDPCREYWYYVESISTSGVREKMTPTFKAAAKRSPRSESPAQ
jgi:pyruvate/2-oxoglutarate dehydrogenase complex dihydrolipoamide acyltransferase (E2) component